MLLSIQFPIADIRTFLDPDPRLTKPTWPFAKADNQFMRFAGAIRKRTAGGIAGWGGENEGVICKANNALAFAKNISLFDNQLGINLILRRTFTYFYFDGTAVGKFEVGVSNKSRPNVHISQKQFPAVLNHFIRLPVRVRNPLGQEKVQDPAKVQDLAQAGRSIAQMFYIASTRKEKVNSQTGSRVVNPGTPILYLEFKEGDVIDIPLKAKFVSLPDEYGIMLYSYQFSYNGGSIQSWLAVHGNKTDRDRARTLRLYLLRLHAEYECLRIVLMNIWVKIITPVARSELSNQLQFYLDKATKNISNLEHICEDQFTPELPYIARKATAMSQPGDLEELLGTIQDLYMRGNIARNTEELIRTGNLIPPAPKGDVFNIYTKEFKIMRDNIDISGKNHSVNIGENNQITNSFGNISNTITSLPNASQADKEALNQLVQQLNKALQDAPAKQQDDAKTVAVMTKNLVDHAAEEKPNKPLISITADGLKAAAVNLNAVIPNVLSIATSIVLQVFKLVGLPFL